MTRILIDSNVLISAIVFDKKELEVIITSLELPGTEEEKERDDKIDLFGDREEKNKYDVLTMGPL